MHISITRKITSNISDAVESLSNMHAKQKGKKRKREKEKIF